MEQRTYQGVLEWAGRRTAPMEIAMQVSDPNGLTSGRGELQLPDGFADLVNTQERATFLTEKGEAFEILFTRRCGNGRMAFLTSGRVSELA